MGTLVKKLTYILPLSAALASLIYACSSANFGGTTKTPANSEDSGTNGNNANPGCKDPKLPCTPGQQTPGGSGVPGQSSPPTLGSNVPTKCQSDKVDLALSNDQKSCIVDQGKTWDFKTGKCGSLPKATWECNWTEAIKALDKNGLTTDTVRKAATDGSKLVTCSQSISADQKTERISLQFISALNGAPNVECSGTQASTLGITSGCYTFKKDGPAENIPPSGTPEFDAYVYNCINNGFGP
jgi:hypothetical protein